MSPRVTVIALLSALFTNSLLIPLEAGDLRELQTPGLSQFEGHWRYSKTLPREGEWFVGDNRPSEVVITLGRYWELDGRSFRIVDREDSLGTSYYAGDRVLSRQGNCLVVADGHFVDVYLPEVGVVQKANESPDEKSERETAYLLNKAGLLEQLELGAYQGVWLCEQRQPIDRRDQYEKLKPWQMKIDGDLVTWDNGTQGRLVFRNQPFGAGLYFHELRIERLNKGFLNINDGRHIYSVVRVPPAKNELVDNLLLLAGFILGVALIVVLIGASPAGNAGSGGKSSGPSSSSGGSSSSSSSSSSPSSPPPPPDVDKGQFGRPWGNIA